MLKCKYCQEIVRFVNTKGFCISCVNENNECDHWDTGDHGECLDCGKEFIPTDVYNEDEDY